MTADRSQLVSALVEELNLNGRVNSFEYSRTHGVDHQRVVGALKSIASHCDDFLEMEQHSKKLISLTPQGNSFKCDGSPEYRLWKEVSNRGQIDVSEAKSLFDGAKIGFDKAMQAGWVRIDKGKVVVKSDSQVTDRIAAILNDLESGVDGVDQKEIKELVKRKLITENVINYFVCVPGSQFSTDLQKPENDLSEELIISGRWRDSKFKGYNLSARGIEPESMGTLHPLMRMRSCFREIFLELGFEEMPTDRYVESCFWNFDALFQPQEHPARDQQDTFFVSEPEISDRDWSDFYEQKVNKVHSSGDYGSVGYQSPWKVEEANKNILRTHTTAVSARMLYKLAQNKPFRPAKYFSIDRVYRNETQDATHLAEFHQVEGLIADRELTLGHLIGIIKQFYNRIGLSKLKFKPAYNPYTEPSMEIFCYHEGLGKLIEVGNSGIFRPEMLLPMGLPEDVRVIAWGLSLERPTMIKLGISNIRELVGHRIDLQMCKKSPFLYFT